MADELTIEWLQAFVMATKQCACGQPWFKFLLMDGHYTHYSLKTMQYAVRNNIVLMYIPDAQPPLLLADSRFPALGGLTVHSRGTGYSEENIKVAFGSTGTHPLNSRMVLGKLRRRNMNIPCSDGCSKPRLLLSHPQTRTPELSAASSDIYCRW